LAVPVVEVQLLKRWLLTGYAVVLVAGLAVGGVLVFRSTQAIGAQKGARGAAPRGVAQGYLLADQGYLASTPQTANFIQWRRSGNHLDGTAYTASITTGTPTFQSSSFPLDGRLHGGHVTLRSSAFSAPITATYGVHGLVVLSGGQDSWPPTSQLATTADWQAAEQLVRSQVSDEVAVDSAGNRVLTDIQSLNGAITAADELAGRIATEASTAQADVATLTQDAENAAMIGGAQAFANDLLGPGAPGGGSGAGCGDASLAQQAMSKFQADSQQLTSDEDSAPQTNATIVSATATLTGDSATMSSAQSVVPTYVSELQLPSAAQLATAEANAAQAQSTLNAAVQSAQSETASLNSQANERQAQAVGSCT
jgi:hypothetical protein